MQDWYIAGSVGYTKDGLQLVTGGLDRGDGAVGGGRSSPRAEEARHPKSDLHLHQPVPFPLCPVLSVRSLNRCKPEIDPMIVAYHQSVASHAQKKENQLQVKENRRCSW